MRISWGCENGDKMRGLDGLGSVSFSCVFGEVGGDFVK